MALQCDRYETENPDTGKFCKECGALLSIMPKPEPPAVQMPAPASACYECRFVNAAGALFCNQCGAPLNKTPPAWPVAQELRPARLPQTPPGYSLEKPQKGLTQSHKIILIAVLCVGLVAVVAVICAWMILQSSRDSLKKSAQDSYASLKDTTKPDEQKAASRSLRQLEAINTLSAAMRSLDGKKKSQSQMSEAEYLDFIHETVAPEADSVREFAKLTIALSKDMSLQNDPAWKNRINNIIDQWESTGQKLIPVTPPLRFIPVHREVITSYMHFLKCGHLFEQYLEDGDMSNVKAATAEIEAGDKSMGRAGYMLTH